MKLILLVTGIILTLSVWAEDKENTVTNDNFAEEKGSSLNAAYGDEELQDFGEDPDIEHTDQNDPIFGRIFRRIIPRKLKCRHACMFINDPRLKLACYAACMVRKHLKGRRRRRRRRRRSRRRRRRRRG